MLLWTMVNIDLSIRFVACSKKCGEYVDLSSMRSWNIAVALRASHHWERPRAINISKCIVIFLPHAMNYHLEWATQRGGGHCGVLIRLVGAKPLSEPKLVYWQLDYWEQISVKFESEFYHFHSGKFIWTCRLPQWRPFRSRGDELRLWYIHIWKRSTSNEWKI